MSEPQINWDNLIQNIIKSTTALTLKMFEEHIQSLISSNVPTDSYERGYRDALTTTLLAVHKLMESNEKGLTK